MALFCYSHSPPTPNLLPKSEYMAMFAFISKSYIQAFGEVVAPSGPKRAPAPAPPTADLPRSRKEGAVVGSESTESQISLTAPEAKPPAAPAAAPATTAVPTVASAASAPRTGLNVNPATAPPTPPAMAPRQNPFPFRALTAPPTRKPPTPPKTAPSNSVPLGST